MADEKELPQNVKDAIALLKSHADHELVIAELKGSPLYQAVFNEGHSDATTRGKTKAKDTAEKLKAAEDRATEAETALAEAKKGAPDLEARDKKWQAKLDAKQAEVDKALGTIDAVRGESIRDKVEVAIAGKLRPKYAKLLAPTLAKQVTRKDDGTFEFHDEGIPVQVPKGKTIWDVVAERAIADADPEDVLTNADSGGGGGSRNNGTSSRTEDQLIAEKRREVIPSF